jgi:hypothetical protein
MRLRASSLRGGKQAALGRQPDASAYVDHERAVTTHRDPRGLVFA